MEIGAYSFGDTPRDADGVPGATADAVRNLFEAVVLADRVGLDYFGVGEHHILEMPVSSPGALIAAAAGATRQITLGSSVSVLSTDDPVRLFQEFATADAVARGRVEITAGRGSTTDSFPLFGYDLAHYDQLYAEKLDLLLAINSSSDGRVTWSGAIRPPLDGLLVVPRPTHGSLPIWLGTGGSAPSSTRAGELGLPVAYGIIGGIPSRFASLAELYRQAAARAGHTGPQTRVSVGTWGLVAPSTAEARERFYAGWFRVSQILNSMRGGRVPTVAEFETQASHPGPYYVGDPDSVAERIVDLHHHMGHVRHILQADIGGGLTQEHFLEHLTLLATEVKPRVQRLLAKK
ncbi:LLM class flavin-dependent oxidoreductase [Streptomyces umbrinus]